jgi:S-adenosylmethionine:tRNA ribosyltransferase-isomerase
LLRAGDVLVLNDTRVVPARLSGHKETGGRIEILIERVLTENRALAHVRASKSPGAGQRLDLEGGIVARVERRVGEFFELLFDLDLPLFDMLDRVGHIPLPPYIARADEPADRERYQTVYARKPGAVAAPTAGLHFDSAMLERLAAIGVEVVYVTLHVGAGTFQPLRGEAVERQRLHAERVHISEDACNAVNRARTEGRRIVAVGTTVVRALESAGGGGQLVAVDGDTDIFIYPGHRFRLVDVLITNFHLPESSLLMLVCAFGGTARVLAAYRHAVNERYRFYSYGDAMFVERGA